MAVAGPADDGFSHTPVRYDVVIVGAGISGIGSARHLRQQCPDLSFTILEAKDSHGGTWLTHRYPGVRSDSDLYTYGYRFKPWAGPRIASGAEILLYLQETIDEGRLAEHIRYRHHVRTARWSSARGCWLLDVLDCDTGRTLAVEAGFLWMCQGYYRHGAGFVPAWPGMRAFEGQIVHPQTWPAGLDYRGRRVVVIGSGATAATLVPAMAREGTRVTLLQRSPSYFTVGRGEVELAEELRALGTAPAALHELVRQRLLDEQREFTRRSFAEPEAVKRELLAGVRAFLGPEFDIDTHFTPRYLPWRQRIAYVPNGDLFDCLASGRASVVTGDIEQFTPRGLRLRDGRDIDADLVVTATGFHLSLLGDIRFSIDGEPIVYSDTVTYRGAMFSGVPNLIWVFGYFRASWTLRVDLIADFTCRLLNHMRSTGARRVVPVLRPEERAMPLAPFIDTRDFHPGYVLRGLHLLPRSGDRPPWRHSQDYWLDREDFPAADLDDGTLQFT